MKVREEVYQSLKEKVESLRTLSTRKVEHVKPFLQAESYQILLNNQCTIVREKLKKGGKDGSAAIVLPITKENEVILTVEPRVFTATTVGIGLPAGYIEPGENASMAAIRELREEVGYTTNTLIPLAKFYQDSGCSAAYNEAFLALDVEQVGSQKLDEGEYIKYLFCHYDEALQLMEEHYIEDANAIIALEKAKKYLKGRR